MSIFSWFKSKPSKTEAISNSVEPTEKEIFQSPELLAKWTKKCFLDLFRLEGNYQHLPSDESRKDLNITYEQEERYVREIPTLRIAGIALFVKQYYNDDFWLKYSRDIYPFLYHHLYGDDHTNEHFKSTVNAVEKYVFYAENRNENSISLHYMRRVYDNSENYSQLTLGGIGYLSIDWLMDAYETFRDAYFNVTQSMSYKSYMIMMEAVEKIENEKSSNVSHSRD